MNVSERTKCSSYIYTHTVAGLDERHIYKSLYTHKTVGTV